MSEIVAYDAYQGRITRVFVWYPSYESSEGWESDPSLQHLLKPMRFVAESNWGYLGSSIYYHNPYASGCVRVIAITVPIISRAEEYMRAGGGPWPLPGTPDSSGRSPDS